MAADIDSKFPAEKLPDQSADFLMVGLKGEMSGIEKVDLRIRAVAPISFGSRRDEEGVVLAPDRQNGRPVLTKVGLEGRIHRNWRGYAMHWANA